jgi:CO/xanthine dehydrogenase FAD-binding subunit
MRSDVPAYELQEPRNLADALDRMAREPGGWKAFAGGTDLMVLLEAGKLPHRKFLSIWKLPELRGITITPAHVTLNALTTYSEIRRHEMLAREFPLLCRAEFVRGWFWYIFFGIVLL